MFPGAWCGHLGVGAWALIGLFWATFLSLVVWAVGRLFTPSRSVEGPDPDADHLDLRLGRGRADLREYGAMREDVASQEVTGTTEVSEPVVPR
jgi:hypothetical protein